MQCFNVKVYVVSEFFTKVESIAKNMYSLSTYRDCKSNGDCNLSYRQSECN